MASKIYKPIGITLSVIGGLIASALFQKIWSLISDEDEAPKARHEHRSWAQVFPSAMLQGAFFAIIKAVIDRSGAAAWKKLTGEWPQ